MNMPDLPWHGGCRCGRVRVRITHRPLLTMACHCTGCQKMSASAYSLSMAIPVDGFEVTKGKAALGGLHATGQEHQHCDWCKSWMFTKLDPAFGFVNVRPTMLDDPQWFEPFVETMTREGLPWAKTPARHGFEGFPEMEAYGPLIEEFASL